MVSDNLSYKRNDMKLTKEIIQQIEVIYRMNKEELYKTYGDMIPENAPEHLH